MLPPETEADVQATALRFMHDQRDVRAADHRVYLEKLLRSFAERVTFRAITRERLAQGAQGNDESL